MVGKSKKCELVPQPKMECKGDISIGMGEMSSIKAVKIMRKVRAERVELLKKADACKNTADGFRKELDIKLESFIRAEASKKLAAAKKALKPLGFIVAHSGVLQAEEKKVAIDYAIGRPKGTEMRHTYYRDELTGHFKVRASAAVLTLDRKVKAEEGKIKELERQAAVLRKAEADSPFIKMIIETELAESVLSTTDEGKKILDVLDNIDVQKELEAYGVL